MNRIETEPAERDERLGEAIEAYLALAESGDAPDPEDFAATYPDLGDELREALAGLALVQGLVGDSAHGQRRLEAGRRVAGYRIVRELGRGGMGIVYEAVHVDLDRPVALKILGAHAAPDSNSRRRFLNEAKTAAGLHHTHIVPVFDVGQVGGLCYYAMQRIEGCGLDRVLKALRRGRSSAAGSGTGTPATIPTRGAATGLDAGADPAAVETASWASLSRSGPGPAKAALGREDEVPTFEPPRGSAYYRWAARVGRQAAEALAHAHHRGVVHRDVKPSNLLVDARGSAWVADFGLARRLADPSLTQSDSLLGTPRYMSPEQTHAGEVDGRSDIYSLGATLYELLTLRPPFDGRTPAELARQIGEREPSPPRRSDPRIPRDLETIVLKAMAKRPTDRYASAQELADDLERFLKFEPVRARRISPIGRMVRFARRHPSLTGVTAAATLVVLTVAAVAHVKVIRERNRAQGAELQMEKALVEAQTANVAMQVAMRRQLLSEAALLRNSAVPDRRVQGREKVARAAAMGPPPGARLRSEMRDEAVQFLAMRDVEARPGFDGGPVGWLAFGPEGRHLMAVSEDGSKSLRWDVERRELLSSGSLRPEGEKGPPPRGQGRTFFGPGVAAADALLAMVRPGGRGLRLFDVATGGAQFRDLDLGDLLIDGLWATPSGHRLVTIDADRDGGFRGRPRWELGDRLRVSLWDTARLREGRPLKVLVEPATASNNRWSPPPLVAVGPDDRTVATARRGDREVALWDAEDGRSLGTIETPSGVSALALGPDGLLAVAGSGTIGLWRVETQAQVAVLSLNQGVVWTMRFSPDRGSLLAVAGPGPGVELWDYATNALVAALPTPEGVRDLAFAPGRHGDPDGPHGERLLVAASGEKVWAWAIVEPTVRARSTGLEERPPWLAFADDGTLVMASFDGKGTKVRLWDPDQCPTTARAWSEDRPVAVALDAGGRLDLIDARSVTRLRLTDREPIGRFALPQEPHRRGPMPSPFVHAAARSADGATLVLARGPDVLILRDGDPAGARRLALAEPPRSRPGRERPWFWRNLAVSPRGDRLYATDPEGRVHAWAIDGDRARDLHWSDLEAHGPIALSPGGETLALAGRSGEISFVETARGLIRARLPGDESEQAASLAFAPKGDVLAVGTRQGTVRLWATRKGVPEPIVRLPGHRGPVATLAFDAQGRRLATGGDDKAVDVWDLDRVRQQLQPTGLGW